MSSSRGWKASLEHRGRQLMPAAATPLLVRARVARAVRDPARVADARAEMELLIGAVRPEADFDALAQDYLRAIRWRLEARWKPYRWQRAVPVEGIGNLDGIGGAVLSFLHHGACDTVGTSFREHGHVTHAITHARFFEPGNTDRHDRSRIEYANRFGTMFSAAEGLDGIVTRLREGKLIFVAPDQPGSTEADFLGRRRRGSSGSVRAALMASCPVVVISSWQDDEGGWRLRVHEPLRPEDYPDVPAMQAAMLKAHEPAVLATPEWYETPSNMWGAPAESAVAS